MRLAQRRRGRPPHDDVLTRAEWRTVHAVQHGMTTKEIARRRGVSLDAVKFHIENALAKLGLTKRKQLREWFAIPRHSALVNSGSPAMSAEITLGSIGQISRSVKDVEASRRFYGEVLGLKHLYTFGKLAFFDCGGTRLFLNEAEQTGNESILYLRVEDIQAAHAMLQSRGVEFISPPHLIHTHADGTEEWMAFFKDLEGRPLAIMSQVARHIG